MNDESVQQTLALLAGFATQLGVDKEQAVQYAQQYLQALMSQSQDGTTTSMKRGGRFETLEEAADALSCLKKGGKACGHCGKVNDKVPSACGGSKVGKYQNPAGRMRDPQDPNTFRNGKNPYLRVGKKQLPIKK